MNTDVSTEETVTVSRRDADQARQAIIVAIACIESLTGIPVDDMPEDSFVQHIVHARDSFDAVLAAPTLTPVADAPGGKRVTPAPDPDAH
jgi:hypothetical protein